MYQEFFSLKELPFSISPDPDFLFLSDRHKEALAHLMYGLQGNGGFVLLTGEVGTGKTTVCRALLEDISDDTDVAFILNPAQTEVELLATICDQLYIPYDVDRVSLKTLFDAISGWMVNNLENGRNAIVLIDEAQHLSFSVLEQLRLLTNIESNNKKPLQVILIGQTELQQKLKENELRQLSQRITARYHLLPLSLKESEYYIQHRLNVAGASFPIFDTRLLKRVFKYSRGIPRLINLICDRSMLCAYSQNTSKVTAKMIDLAVQEMDLSFASQVPSQLIKNVWRVGLLVILTVITVVQAPKILNYFNQPVQVMAPAPVQRVAPMPVSAPVEMVETSQREAAQQNIETNNQLNVDNNPPQKNTSYAPEEYVELSWFDNYPDLDLSKGEFAHALQTLYAVWGYGVNLTDATCQKGAAVSLQCFSDSTSLAKLRQFNYPAVIKLVSDEDAIYAVLYRIDEQYEVLIGTQKINVTEMWLREYWNGGVTFLWRTPFDLSKPLKFGEKGDQVAWLNDKLNLLYDLPESDKNRFDWKLKEQVMDFQSDNDLTPDGIVGKRTLIPLVQQIEPNTPSLF